MKRKDIANAVGCALGSVALGWVMYHFLVIQPAGLPMGVSNIFILGIWILLSGFFVLSALVGLLKRADLFLLIGACLRLLLGLGGIVAFCVLSDVGILFVGHKYWIQRAFDVPTASEAATYLDVVLKSTQYGKDVAATAIEGLPESPRRRELRAMLEEESNRR